MPQTLLLADDSVTIQRVIELTFADEDIDVIAVSDGDQAIARLETMPPDIILVDVGMPGKSGYEVAAYVKQSPRLSHIPVVLLTGAFEPVDEARAAGAGCDGVLAKPFEPQLVIGRVKELLGRPAPTRSAGGTEHAFEAPVPEAENGTRDIDDYFDQLDAAFSNLSGRPAPAAAASPQIDWFGLKTAGSPSTPEPEPEPEMRPSPPEPAWAVAARSTQATQAAAPEPWQSAAPAPASAPVPPAPSAAATVPPLADAFAALLEAEQSNPHTAPAAWPAPAAAAPVVLTDDLVAQVSARVLEQLTDRVVREAVAEIAERLIREEIERIKASIQ